jgi:hypothetical protein
MNLFSTRDENFHRSQKKPNANAYSMTSFPDPEPAVDSCMEIFFSQLRKLASSKNPINPGVWLQYYAFNIVGEFSFA